MRIRVLDRILVALAGLLLVAACSGLVAQVFFGKDVIGLITKLLEVETTTGKIIAGVCAGVLLLLGLYCLLMLFRHRRRKDKFILQKCAIPVETVQLWFQLGLVTLYALLLAAQRLLRFEHDTFEWRHTIPATGVLLVAADWLYFHGLAIPDAPISAGSLLRRFSVVITFVLGAAVFHEHNLKRKGLALAAILAGVVLLCLKV